MIRREGKDMQKLPDFLVLDFCEWIKHTTLSKSKYSGIDLRDLLFNDRYEDILIKKAQVYCNKLKKEKNSLKNSIIIEGKELKKIVEGVNDMGEERRNKERPIQRFVQNANGATNVQQNMVIDSTGTNIFGNFLKGDSDLFEKEIEKAISIVASSNLSEVQKKELQNILEEAEEGVQEKSDEKISSSKKRFSTFRTFAGDMAKELIDVLAGLVTIAQFFGI